MSRLKGNEIKRLYGAIRQVVPATIDLEDNKEYKVETMDNKISIHDESLDLIYYCRFDIQKQIPDGVDYKSKYEKCIDVIKKFDAGIIGMYDL